jgi:hypothetical protein
LRILTGLSQEELQVFEALVTTFGKRHGLTVTVENVHWPQALAILKQEKGTVDLITFDINGARFELVHNNLVEDLSGVKGLLPSLMHPGMMKSLDVTEQRFFLPFRPNVRLVFVNRKKLAELSSNRLETWADVLDVAKRWYARDGEPRVVVEAGEADAPLLLLELMSTWPAIGPLRSASSMMPARRERKSLRSMRDGGGPRTQSPPICSEGRCWPCRNMRRIRRAHSNYYVSSCPRRPKQPS